jgi:peptidoglycan/xylan/chitin deacetylase (PgdA/CDA1 family)
MKLKISVEATAASLLLTFLILLTLNILFHGQKIAFVWEIIFFFGVETVLFWGVFDHKSPLFGRVFWRGSKKLSVLALTFDDGPTEPYTSAILEVLRDYQVRATFFVLGKKIEFYPDVLKKIAEAGHEIGNHGYSHEVMPLKSALRIREEIRRTEDLIFSETGQRPRLFRAPHGWKGPWLVKAVSEAGYRMVSWTHGVRDTDRPGEGKIIQRSLRGLKNGSVLLFHDGRGVEEKPDCSQLVKALPIIIENACSQGYKLMTVSKIMAISKTVPGTGCGRSD